MPRLSGPTRSALHGFWIAYRSLWAWRSALRISFLHFPEACGGMKNGAVAMRAAVN